MGRSTEKKTKAKERSYNIVVIGDLPPDLQHKLSEIHAAAIMMFKTNDSYPHPGKEVVNKSV